MLKRLELKVTGQVQRVGYRDRVDKIAYELHITGTVQNLPDRSVRIICEGEPRVLDEFLTKLHINERYIQVDELSIVSESRVTGEFEYFQIIRGDMVEELKGSFDMGLERLRVSTDEIKEAIDDSRDVLQSELKSVDSHLSGKLDEVKQATYDSRDVLQSELKSVDSHLSKNMETLTHETETFREQSHTDLEQTHADFSELDVKYDRVSASLESIDSHVQDVTHALDNMSQTLVKTVNSKG